MEEEITAGELIYYAFTLSTSFKELRFIPLSDKHDGNPLSSDKHWFNSLKLLEKPNVYAGLNGDLIEAALKSSVGDVFSQKGTPQDQIDRIIKQLYPYRKKILGVTDGNHEWRIYKETGFLVGRHIAKSLNVPYRPEGIIIKISFGSGNEGHEDRPYTYWVYMTHGYGGARTKSAKAVKAERISAWLPSMDVIIMSHDHVVNIAPDVCLEPDPRTRPERDKEGKETGFTIGRVRAHRRMLVKANAYIKFGGYAEMGGFPPTDLAVPIIKFSGIGKPKVSVEI